MSVYTAFDRLISKTWGQSLELRRYLVPNLHSTDKQHFLWLSEDSRTSGYHIGFMIGDRHITFASYYTLDVSRKWHHGIFVCSSGFRNGSENTGLEVIYLPIHVP